MKFAITGVGGFVAPKHLQAIKDVEGTLTAALDPNDSVGILDKFNKKTQFFTSPERFERHLHHSPVDWLSVCSPNYLHDTHARMGLHTGADVICEKPLTLTPWNLDALEQSERVTGKRVFAVLQLRHQPSMLSLKNEIFFSGNRRHKVKLEYVTPRGSWYHTSWKGDTERSGGLVTNIGIHMLDLLLWIFGTVDNMSVKSRSANSVSGTLVLASADVEWLLSIDESASPNGAAHRFLTVDGGAPLSLSDGFTDLHTKVYQETLAGRGHGIADARPAVELANRLRYLPIVK